MLPVNVEGITWLTTNYTTYNTPIITAVLIYVLGVLGLCGGIALIATLFYFGLKEKGLILYFIIMFVGCIISLLTISHGEKKNRDDFVPEPISYMVYIEDNADYKTLIQNYTIESEQDNLTTIVLKEN